MYSIEEAKALLKRPDVTLEQLKEIFTAYPQLRSQVREDTASSPALRQWFKLQTQAASSRNGAEAVPASTGFGKRPRKKKKKRSAALVAGVAGVIVVALIVAAVAFFARGNGNDDGGLLSDLELTAKSKLEPVTMEGENINPQDFRDVVGGVTYYKGTLYKLEGSKLVRDSQQPPKGQWSPGRFGYLFDASSKTVYDCLNHREIKLKLQSGETLTAVLFVKRDLIFAYSDTSIIAFDGDGERLWKSKPNKGILLGAGSPQGLNVTIAGNANDVFYLINNQNGEIHKLPKSGKVIPLRDGVVATSVTGAQPAFTLYDLDAKVVGTYQFNIDRLRFVPSSLTYNLAGSALKDVKAAAEKLKASPKRSAFAADNGQFYWIDPLVGAKFTGEKFNGAEVPGMVSMVLHGGKEVVSNHAVYNVGSDDPVSKDLQNIHFFTYSLDGHWFFYSEKDGNLTLKVLTN